MSHKMTEENADSARQIIGELHLLVFLLGADSEKLRDDALNELRTSGVEKLGRLRRLIDPPQRKIPAGSTVTI